MEIGQQVNLFPLTDFSAEGQTINDKGRCIRKADGCCGKWLRKCVIAKAAPFVSRSRSGGVT